MKAKQQLITDIVGKIINHREKTGIRGLRDEIIIALDAAETANPSIEAGAPRTSYYKSEEDADWEHFGCEVCGNLFKLPWKEGSRLPFCAGHGSNYAWPTSSEHELELKDYGWIQMKQVEIRVKEAPGE